MSEEPKAGKKKKRGMLAIATIVALTLVGGGAGMFAPRLMGAEAKSSEEAVPAPHADIRSMDVGRIVVNVGPPNGMTRHLVIQAIVEYDAALLPAAHGGEGGDHGEAAEGESPEAALYRPKVRDAFIDYLANLSEPEIRGSSGMSALRQELLGRARLAFGNEAPKALLIQDYVLQ